MIALKRIGFLRRFSFVFLWLLSGTLLLAQKATLDKTIFVPGEPLQTILHVSEKGWYHIVVKSPTGTGLSLIDRMSGTLASDGYPGRTDGQLNQLLLEGEYKINLSADNHGKGPINLEIKRFTELNSSGNLLSLPTLREGDFIPATLKEQEIRSYWIEIKKNIPLHLEVMARSLIACRLWRDGEWLTAERSTKQTYEPVKGRPMPCYIFDETLEPGYYLLQCVGGTPAAWTNENKEHPFYLRYGVEYLGKSNCKDLTISPFGTDYYWVAPDATFFQLFRKDVKPATMSLNNYALNNSRTSYAYNYASIDKGSKEPRCSLVVQGGSDTRQWLKINGEPGDKVSILFFPRYTEYSFSQTDNNKRFWIAGVSSLEADVSEDLTPLVFKRTSKSVSVADGKPVKIGPDEEYIRQINLFEQSTIYCYVTADGSYRVKEKSAQGQATATYQFTLLNDSQSYYKAENYKPGDTINLKKGYYKLNINPVKVGILQFCLFHSNLWGEVSRLLDGKASPPQQDFYWSEFQVNMGKNESLTLALNPRSVASAGLILRELPLNLEEPLLLHLQAGAQVFIPVYVRERSTFFIRGDGYELTAGSTPWTNNTTISPGTYNLVLKNTSQAGAYYALTVKTIPPNVTIATPDIKPPQLIYPVLSYGHPVFDDYDRNETKQFLLRVTEPAFYRLATGGRLNMSLNLRSKLVTSLFSASNNTTGTNALIETYIKPGDYLIEAKTLGRSMGRASVVLSKTEIPEEGTVIREAIFRNTVEKDHGLMYRLDVRQETAYNIETIGPGTSFNYRLEDADGWPLVLNNSEAFDNRLAPGRYYYYSLPTGLKTRRVTRISLPELANKEPPASQLLLNFTKQSVWQEKEGRVPDLYTLTLPAELTVTIYLSKGMEGEFATANNKLADLKGDDRRTLKLGAGNYTFKVKSKEINNSFPYQLVVSTTQLIPGMSQIISGFPATLAISNPRPAIIHFWSYGRTDVSASLWNADGTRQLAANDDQDNDWNFKITQKLDTGLYQLKINREGQSYGNTIIYIDTIAEEALPAKKLPFTLTQDLGQEIIEVPFITGGTPGLCGFTANAGTTVMLSLYRDNKLLASRPNGLYIPLEANTNYKLQAQNAENTTVAVTLNAAAFTSQPYKFNGRAETLSIKESLVIENSPGLSFLFRDSNTDLLYSDSWEHACDPVTYLPLNTLSGQGWVMSGTPGTTATCTIQPLEVKVGGAANFLLQQGDQSFRLTGEGSSVLLIKAESPGNKLGVMVSSKENYKKQQYSWQGMTVSSQATYTGVPGQGEFQGKIWRLANSDNSVPAGLAVLSFALQQTMPLKVNNTVQTAIKPGTACTFTLEDTSQEVSLLLAEGLIAYSWNKGTVEWLTASSGVNRPEQSLVSGGTVAIINPGKSEQLFRITAVKAGQSQVPEVTGRAAFEQVMEREGILRIRITPDSGLDTLYVAGDSYTSTLGGNDGRLYTGESLPGIVEQEVYPLRAGLLEIRYAPGFIRIRQCSKASLSSALAEPNFSMSASSLASYVELENKPQLWTLNLKTTGYIQLQSKVPGVTALCADKNVLAAAASATEAGRSIFYYLEKGTYQVFTRPLGKETQTGGLIFTELPPLVLTGDGDNPRTLLGPGEKHFYAFTVQAEGKIGMGVKTDRDALQVDIYDNAFKRIASGPLSFMVLKPGKYYMLVSSRDEIVQYTPQVFGANGSVSDIPVDVINQYKKNGE